MTSKPAHHGGTPQGTACAPHTLNAAEEKAVVKKSNEGTAAEPAPKEEPVAKEAMAEKEATGGRNDKAIIDALMSRQWDLIYPHLPEGDDPVTIKLAILNEKYDIHHDPEVDSDDSEEADFTESETTERNQHN